MAAEAAAVRLAEERRRGMKRTVRSILVVLAAAFVIMLWPEKTQAADTTKPEAPTITSIKETDAHAAKLTWKKVTGVKGYVIYRATSKNGKYSKVKTITTNKTTWTDTGVKAGKTYYYKMKSYRKTDDSKIYSIYSAKKSIKIVGAEVAEDYSTLSKALNTAVSKGLIKLKKVDGKQYIVLGSFDTEEGHWDEDYTKFETSSDGTKDDLLWEVLEYSADRKQALVLCKNVIAFRPYNVESADVTWETCTLRKWLNDDFINSAFTSAQRKMIVSSKLTNADNADFKTAGGNATTDKIFLLSLDEIYKFYDDDRNLGSDTRIRKTYAGEDWYWWLRSPGNSSDYAADITRTGAVGMFGSFVYDYAAGVCPAFWINLNP